MNPCRKFCVQTQWASQTLKELYRLQSLSVTQAKGPLLCKDRAITRSDSLRLSPISSFRWLAISPDKLKENHVQLRLGREQKL